ncbi:hypothetical protein BBK36DRAFT_1108521 [Trichoderma citrinoviride]|uniref:Uncharacterized protein n=1 Tax=Trichoderma citrinoviride TaxID=58853 RepID=A0A2T4BNJ0_9HYPO|nr:hypothetical protein BBK36DRAFT_1108521 [Trichoderma citrinoviride]PTB70888.1 hypothetical protein BBK36DRAFT_1108521 [Trichoderma citrinoviride]
MSALSDEPEIIKLNPKTLTRDEVMEEMQPILLRLNDYEWTTELAADIAAVLTPQKLKVMPRRAKASFTEWIYQQEDKKYIQWLENASDDLISITWNEMKRIPGAKIWSQGHPIASALDQLVKAADEFSPEQKDFVQARVTEIRGYIQCEKEREPQEVEQFTATVLKAIEKTEATIIDRLGGVHGEMR